MILDDLMDAYQVSDSLITNNDKEKFQSYFEPIEVKKGTYLIKEGEIEFYSYYISSGILKCWVYDVDIEPKVFWFSTARNFSMSNVSFSLQKASEFYVETVTDCMLYKTSYPQVLELYKELPHVASLMNTMTAQLMNTILLRQINLIKYTPEQHYIWLQQYYKEQLNYIPLQDIASYLGITPQALSRIRKRIS
ncbi:MAG: Crp/Fnr family transcriptional regulator [Flavobacteriaceae bacterium]|jgi:CRP-like cAMP-binding protein|nr:Crp/Fnr family transcriptional regulator [Flavobacteriaceae bacterium]